MAQVREHEWYKMPSKKAGVTRRWCQRCGCLAEGDLLFAKQWPPWKESWQYVTPGDPPKIWDRTPPCHGGEG